MTRKSSLLGAVAIVATLVGVLSAQAPPAFEVASIKQATFLSDAYFAGFQSSGGAGACAASAIRIAGNGATLTKVTPCSLILLAYGIHDYQVAGAPDWMTKPDKSIYYDIDARAENGMALTQERAREMLRTLLADRFQLKIHHDLREVPVYALVVGKSGPKFPGNAEKFVTSRGIKPCSDPSFKGGAGGGVGGLSYIASCGPSVWGSMAALAQNLSTQTDRAVVDRTGLTGQYTFLLEWTPEGRTPAPDAPPSIFTAIQDQLGLKLDPRKEPADTVVIDRVERPTPN